MSSAETHLLGQPDPGLLAMEAEPVHLPLGVTIDELVKVNLNYFYSFRKLFTLNLTLYASVV